MMEYRIVFLLSHGELVSGADAKEDVSFPATSATGTFVSDVVESRTCVGK